MAEDKRSKFALRMSQDAQDMVKDLFEQDNCQSQTEFIEKAVRFYAGYISAQKHSQCLSDVLISSLQATLENSEAHMGRLLYKLAVEVDMMMHVLASGLEIPDEELRKLRGQCIAEVNRTNGRITFDEVVKSYNNI